MVTGPKQKSFKDQNETLGQNMLVKKWGRAKEFMVFNFFYVFKDMISAMYLVSKEMHTYTHKCKIFSSISVNLHSLLI